MKIHKIIFFVGVLLIVNQFLGIPSDVQASISVIFGVTLVGLGAYLKLQNVKKQNSMIDKNNIDHKAFVENSPMGAPETEVVAESAEEYSPNNPLDENINDDIESLNNSDESKDIQ
jgi:hypothetical protein